jgi:hypothetical protein
MPRLPNLSRRSVLKASATASLVLTGTGARALGQDSADLVIFDGRAPLSRQFAERQSGRLIDVVDEEGNAWRTLRTITAVENVRGVTRWSEFLMACSFLEERGLRVRSSAVVPGNLILWHTRRQAELCLCEA